MRNDLTDPAVLRDFVERGRRAQAAVAALLTPPAPPVETVVTATPPLCVLCRKYKRANWNGREPGAQARAMAPPVLAEYYARARGTTGWYRHICAACLEATGDTPLLRFVPPPTAGTREGGEPE